MQFTRLPRYQLLFLLFLLSQFLHSCGLVDEPTSSVVCVSNCSASPSSPTASAQQVGVFVDSAVAGVTFQSNSGLSGTTNSAGEFDYIEGETISFSLGGIDLGSVVGSAVLTPVEVMGATETADDKVINLTRFLQSLDEDGDPTNGITITSSVSSSLQGTSINFNDNSSNFEAAVSSVVSTAIPGRSLVDATTALNHLHGSMEDWGKNDKVSDETAMKRKVPSFVSENDTWPIQLDNLTPSIASVDGGSNFYLAGKDEQDRAVVRKYNRRGALQWEQPSTAVSEWSDLQLAPNGDAYLLGQQSSAVLLKLDKDGSELWTTEGLAGESHSRLAVSESGSFYVEGEATVSDSTSRFFLKFDKAGDNRTKILLKDFPSSTALIDAWKVDHQGNFYLTTERNTDLPELPGCINDLEELDALPFERAHLEKYSADGKRLWRKRLASGSSFSSIWGLALDDSAEIYVAGTRYQWDSGNPDFFAGFFLEKYSASGELLWSVTPGTTAAQGRLTNIALDKGGNLYVAGNLADAGQLYPFVESYQGKELQWRRWLHSDNYSRVFGLTTYTPGKFYLAVQTTDTPKIAKILKLDANQTSNPAPSTTVTSVVHFQYCNNNPPTASDRSLQLPKNSAGEQIVLSGVDSDEDYPLYYTIVSGPTHGSVTLTENIVTYKPNADYVGSDEFYYSVTDSRGASSENASVNIQVLDILPEPAYSVDNFTVVADNSSTISTSWDLYPDNGSQAPQGFLLICSADNDTQPPTDNISLADDPDCSDGGGVINLVATETGYTWTNLKAAQQYFFQIFAMTNTDQPEYIDYLTSGSLQWSGVVTPSANLPEGIFCGGDAEWSCERDDVSRFDEAIFAD